MSNIFDTDLGRIVSEQTLLQRGVKTGAIQPGVSRAGFTPMSAVCLPFYGNILADSCRTRDAMLATIASLGSGWNTTDGISPSAPTAHESDSRGNFLPPTLDPTGRTCKAGWIQPSYEQLPLPQDHPHRGRLNSVDPILIPLEYDPAR
jgi:hypothetical protein